ncbi:MAG: tRNA (guanosine(37)-N1)-methyltransferase TrmD [Christensenellales bacterium]
MKFEVLTLFPEMFDALKIGILGKAQESGKIVINATNIRDYTKDKHGKVDDTPFGGGAGMVMTPAPVVSAIRAVDPEHKYKRIYLSPKGRTLTQSGVKDLSKEEGLLLLCGSYEGIDQRAIDLEIDEELSIGDYVLTSGELPAMVVINCVSRYIDGVLHSADSVVEESFSDNLLEYPQYTKPRVYEGLAVPDVLVSGNHGEIDKWRKEQSLQITKERRPDLLVK